MATYLPCYPRQIACPECSSPDGAHESMRLANPRDSLGKSAIHILRHRVWQWAILLSLCPVPPASAQTAPTDPAAAHTQSGQHDIIVTGRTEEQKSDWKRAESDHVIVFSTGSE